MNPEERIQAVVEAIYDAVDEAGGCGCCAGVTTDEASRTIAKNAIAKADATRPKLEVTDAMVGKAWALYCEYLIHDNFNPITMRHLLESLKVRQ